MSRSVTCLLASCILMALVLVPATAYPGFGFTYDRDMDTYEPEDILEMLNRLRNAIRNERFIQQSEKRALDFGLGRGYTGELQAKHLMGQAAANDAGGPGRRRRDTHQMHQ